MDTVAGVSIQQLVDILVACIIFTGLTSAMLLLNDVSEMQDRLNANVAVVDDYIIDTKYSEKIIYAQDIIALFMEIQGRIPIDYCGRTYGGYVNGSIRDASVFNLATLQGMVDYNRKYYAFLVYDNHNRLDHYAIRVYNGTIPSDPRSVTR